jgi:hypothetical protein
MTENYYVYKLYNNDYPQFYIGSTTDIVGRKRCHKHNCTNENSPKHNYKLYQYIRDHGGYSNWSYEILEYIRNSINIYELRNVERKYIEELKPDLNGNIPNRTDKEYYRDNKEAIKILHKQYRENNKELIKQKKNQKFNCSCGGKYTKTNKAQHFKSNKHRSFIS